MVKVLVGQNVGVRLREILRFVCRQLLRRGDLVIGSPGRVAIPLLPVLEDSACRAFSRKPQRCFSNF